MSFFPYMSTEVTRLDNAAAPRLYLKVSRKRRREGFVEEAPAPRLVRLQWDAAEMGAAPPALLAALSSRTNVVFRRLQRCCAGGLPEVSPISPLCWDRNPPSASTTAAPLKRLTQTGRCLVIECGDDNARSSGRGGEVELFVFDSEATEREAMREAFGEFALTDGDASSPPCKEMKRMREEEAEGAYPSIFLSPRPRLSLKDNLSSAELATTPSPPTQWGSVEQDAEGTMWELLKAYDDELCMEAEGEAAADLYCYPDHRKDDEYDSNAEDYSGNDYPEDADDPSSDVNAEKKWGDASDSSTGGAYRHAPAHGTYGMFWEEEYSENSLGSGWASDS